MRQYLLNFIRSQKRRKVRRNHPNAFFTLLEVLVTCAIVLILAGLLIPKLLQARAQASETAAGGAVRSLTTAAVSYNTKWGVFPPTASAMGGTCDATTPPTAAASCILDDKMATSIGTSPIGKYDFAYTVTGSGAGFTLTADPATGNNATRHYYTNESMVIRANDSGPATATDNPIGN